jgi:hypothetical protein
VGICAGLDSVKKRTISIPCWELNPGRPARSLLTILTKPSRLNCIILPDN